MWRFVVLGATFLVLAGLNTALYGLFAGLRDAMRNRRVQRLFNWCGGGALIGAGVITAAVAVEKLA